MQVLAVGFQVEDGITHQLPGPVVGHVTPATGVGGSIPQRPPARASSART